MSLRKEDFVYLNAQGNLKSHKDEALDIPQGVKSLKQMIGHKQKSEPYLLQSLSMPLLSRMGQTLGFMEWLIVQKG